MSNRLINLAYKCDLNSSAKAVIIFLADQVREKKDRDKCYPSVETIARNTGLSPRTVRYKLKELEEAGHITRHFRSDNSTLYQVHPGKGCTPAKAAGVQHSPATPANDDKNPCNRRRETFMNPKKNRGATPFGIVASGIVHRQIERGDGNDPVDPEAVSAFVKSFREQK
jgi:DNA-binding transcriptional ArsR family regulator